MRNEYLHSSPLCGVEASLSEKPLKGKHQNDADRNANVQSPHGGDKYEETTQYTHASLDQESSPRFSLINPITKEKEA